MSKKIFKDESLKEVLLRLSSEHNTLRFAIIAAVISTALGALSYCYHCAILNGWNISVDYLTVFRSDKILYFLLFGVMYFILITLLQPYLSSKSTRLLMIVCAYSALSKMENVFLKLELSNKYPSTISKIEGIKTRCKQVGRQIGLKTLIAYIVGILLYTGLYCLLVYVVAGDTQQHTSLATITYMTCCVFLGSICHTFLTIPSEVTDLKDKVCRLEDSAVSTSQKLDNIVSVADSIAMVLTKLKNSKSGVERSIMSLTTADIGGMVASSILMGAAIIFIGYLTPKMQKDFWIYNNGSETYAVVYVEGERIFLKRADIQDDSIRIYLDKQIITTGTDKSLVYYKFETSELISGRLNSSETELDIIENEVYLDF